MKRRVSFRKAAVTYLTALALVGGPGFAQQPAPGPSAAAPSSAAPAAAPMKQEELDQLLAPIALYPDSLLSQMFMAATYPLEIVEADRWAKANPTLKDKALTTELEKKTWDASVKSLVNFPDILSMMSEKLDMTTKLGDAFIADSKRMMDSVQKLRAKAKSAGNLKSSDQMTVKVEPAPAGTTTTNTEVIVIESPSPQVVYVPSYNPTVVYGSWPYPSYPPYPYYPPPPANGWVAGAVGFGVGLACGAAWGYAWGGCNWGHGDVDIDIDRNTNINTNIDRSKAKAEFNNRQTNVGANGRGSFQHDPAHRQGVAYRDKSAQQKFGGTRAQQTNAARNDFRGKADAGRQDIARGGASDFAGRGNAAGRGGVQDRAGAGGSGVQNRAGAGGAGVQDRAAGAAQNRAGAGGSGVQNRASTAGTKSGAFDGVGQSSSRINADSARGAASRNTGGISGAQRPSGGISRPSSGGMSRPSGGGARPARTGGGRR